jgi:hypothetical protein
VRSRVLPLIAIGAALAAVGIAAIAAWRLGKTPAATAAEAEQLDLWEPAWKAMRACVLGPVPASTDLGEAIAAADLVVPERTCGHELVALARAAGGDAAWSNVRRGIGELAEALGRHGQRRQAPATVLGEPKPDPLPPVLADLEKAVARVRPPDDDDPPPPRVLTQLGTLPVVVDGEFAQTVSIWRNTIHVQVGDSYGMRRQIQFVDGQPRSMVQASYYYTEAIWSPRATWQAYVEDDGAKAKIKVANATLGEMSTVASAYAGSAYVWAVIGEGDGRLVVYTDDTSTQLARSTDAGAHWKKTKLPGGLGGGYLATAVSSDGNRLEIVWADGVTKRMVLDPQVHSSGPLPEPETISPALSWLQCNTGALWLVLFESETDYVVRRADTATASGRFKTQPYVSSCSADKVALLADNQEFACDATACAPLAKLAAAPLTIVVGNEVLRYQTWDNVIALWWGDQPPVFARLPGNRQVAGVVDDHGTAIAVLQAEGRVEYASLPK